jgi:hypothetical protein
MPERRPSPDEDAGRCRRRRSASPTPAPARCTSWPRWTASRACAPCWPVRRRGHRRGRRLRAHGRQARGHLLHLGCGLGNGLANLHNARKGKVPVVNIVGDHATSHVPYDAQLQSDIETVARNVSPGFVRTSQSATADLCRDAVDAIAAARGLPGQVATLILPADVSWGDGGVPAPPAGAPSRCGDRRRHRAAIARPSAREPNRAAAGRARPARARPAGGGAHRGALRRQAAGRGLPHAAGARRGPARRGAHRLPGRNGRRAVGRASST